MVPSIFIPLSSMPCTASGKTDRRKLKDIFQTLSEKTLSVYRGRGDYPTKRKPTTTTQILIRDLWADALHIDASAIELDDNFFRIGGDSISAIQLVSAFRKKGLSLAVTEIHQSSGLEDMAALLDTRNRSKPPPLPNNEIPVFSLLDIESPSEISALLQNVAAQCCTEPRSIQDIYPCSPLQEGLMGLSIRENGIYLCQMIYRLSSTTDLDRFRAAWEDVITNNEILRTRIVHVPTQGSLQVVLKSHTEWQTGNDLQEYLETERSRSLAYGDPLCRYGVFTGDIGETYFVLNIHHVRIDICSTSGT